MNIVRAVTAAVVATTAVSGLAATSAQAAGTTGAHQSYTRTSAVYSGSMISVQGKKITAGNRHVVTLTTVDAKTSGTMKSYYCPSATVTTTMVPSTCVLRGSYTLKAAPMYEGGPAMKIGRVSRTGASARQQGELGVYKDGAWRGYVPVDLTLRAFGDSDADDFLFYRNATLTGTFAGLSRTSGVKYRAILGWPIGC